MLKRFFRVVPHEALDCREAKSALPFMVNDVLGVDVLAYDYLAASKKFEFPQLPVSRFASSRKRLMECGYDRTRFS